MRTAQDSSSQVFSDGSGDPDSESNATLNATENAANSRHPLNLGPPASPGQLGKLGFFHLETELGRGGMGVVFKAFDPRLNRKLAIKVMLPSSTTKESAKKRFLREAAAAARVKHVNVITIYETNEIEGNPYIAMEYLEGFSLEQLIRRHGRPALNEVVRIASESVAGLAAAHKMEIMHRDIKPSNLWIESPHGRVKLLDFGLAKEISSGDDLTAPGAVLGTPAYMSPEQARGGTLDHRSDIFSLGAVFYFLCTGNSPFKGDSAYALIMSLGSDHPIPITDLNPEIPQELAALVHQMLSKRIDERPSSVNEIAERLAGIVSRLDSIPAPQLIPIKVSESVTIVSNDERGSDRTKNSPNLGNTVPESSVNARFLQPRTTLPKRWWPGVSTRVAGLLVGFMIAALLFGVIITIERSDGTKIVIEVPTESNSKITVADGGTEGSNKAPALESGIERKAGAGRLRILSEKEVQRRQNESEHASTTGDDNGIAATTFPDAAAKKSPLLAMSPFNASAARVSQDAWAKDLGVPIQSSNSIGMTLRLVPPGRFMMGMTRKESEAVAARNPSDESWKNASLGASPPHQVTIMVPFYLGTYEVTQEQYEKVMGVNPSYFSAKGQGKEAVKDSFPAQHPVEMVSHIDAAIFCNKLSERENLTPAYLISNGTVIPIEGSGYRLPTEAEWEWACRAGTVTTWSHDGGEESLGGAAWFATNGRDRTHAVGQTSPNPFGLCDMHGNVSEWCQDWYEPYEVAKLVDPRGPREGSTRVIRGGSWRDVAADCQSARRNWFAAADKGWNLGFRIARSLARRPDETLAAQWVLRKKGTIGIEGLSIVVSKDSDLPKVPFKVIAVDLQGHNVTDEGFEHVAEFKSLSRLTAWATATTDRTMVQIGKLGRLRELIVTENTVGDDSAAAFAGLKQLEVLTLSRTRIGDKTFRMLPECVNLRSLNVERTLVTSRGLAHLPELSNLRTLVLNYTSVDDLGMHSLALCKSLDHLSLEGTSVGDDGCRSIGRITTLEVLSLAGTNVSDAGVEHLLGLSKMKTLHLHGSRVTDKSLAMLSDLPFLGDLIVADTLVSDAGIRHLRNLSVLRTLGLKGTATTDAGLEELVECSKLEHLNLEKLSITDRGLEPLSKLASLRILVLHGTQVTKAGVEALHKKNPQCHIEYDGGVIEPVRLSR